MLSTKSFKNKKKRHLESAHQRAFFDWLSYYPKLRGSTFAIPNGGSRHPKEALNLKRTGTLAGVPDVFMAIPNKNACGAFIEFKAGKNKPTERQTVMLERLRDNGYECFVCYSVDEAQQAVVKYLEQETSQKAVLKSEIADTKTPKENQ